MVRVSNLRNVLENISHKDFDRCILKNRSSAASQAIFSFIKIVDTAPSHRLKKILVGRLDRERGFGVETVLRLPSCR